MTVAQYDSPEKQLAIAEITRFVNQTGVTPKRIFTLPSSSAQCARQFTASWPSSFILGLDGQKKVIRTINFVKGSGKRDNECLDVIVGGVAVGAYLREGMAWCRKDPLKTGNGNLEFRHYGIGKFDLIFLDYTCSPSEMNAQEVNDFAARHGNDGAIVVVTLTIGSRRVSDCARDASGELAELKRLGYPKFDHYYPYGNSNSNMCVAIWKT